MRAGRELEVLTARIKSVLHPNAKVESPSLLIDVDTGQPREVDVLVTVPAEPRPIRIAVECRDRASSQDVTWIEQLVTKKESIDVDLLIAVSTSSFSAPALLKAAKRGVVVRRVLEAVPDEIAAWASETYVELRLLRVEVAEPVLTTRLGKVATTPGTAFVLNGKATTQEAVIVSLLQQLFPRVAPRLTKHGHRLPLRIDQHVPNLVVRLPYELPVLRVTLRAVFRRHVERLPAASGFTYDDAISARRMVDGYHYGTNTEASSELLMNAETKHGTWRVDFRNIHGWFEGVTLKAVEPVAVTKVEVLLPASGVAV